MKLTTFEYFLFLVRTLVQAIVVLVPLGAVYLLGWVVRTVVDNPEIHLMLQHTPVYSAVAGFMDRTLAFSLASFFTLWCLFGFALAFLAGRENGSLQAQVGQSSIREWLARLIQLTVPTVVSVWVFWAGVNAGAVLQQAFALTLAILIGWLSFVLASTLKLGERPC